MSKYPKCIEKTESLNKQNTKSTYQDAFNELIQMAKEFHDAIKKVIYMVNSEMLRSQIVEACEQLLKKYSDKPKD